MDKSAVYRARDLSPEQRHAAEVLLGKRLDDDDLLTVRAAKEIPPQKNLAQFLMESPLAGAELNLERQTDYGRSIDL